MSTKINTSEQAKALGNELKLRRKSRKISLIKASHDLGIDAGQLSRFENGLFVYLSNNMQIYIDYLQMPRSSHPSEENLTQRFQNAIIKSSKHLEIATYMVSFLESLENINE